LLDTLGDDTAKTDDTDNGPGPETS
jgi:hypothetical protein